MRSVGKSQHPHPLLPQLPALREQTERSWYGYSREETDNCAKQARKPPNSPKPVQTEENKEQNQSTVKAAEGNSESPEPRQNKQRDSARQQQEFPRQQLQELQLTAPCTLLAAPLLAALLPARARRLLLPCSASHRAFEETARQERILFQSGTTPHGELPGKRAPQGPGK